MSYDLIKLRHSILNIAKEIKRICDENDINYTMIGGTLIGAVRHQGFIPWDDDMDFAMTRKDYNKFLQACKTELNPQFEILNWRINNTYANGFTKIMLKGTKAIEAGKENVTYPCGIFVDVFPFDNIPEAKIKQIVQKWTTYISLRMLQQKDGSIRRYDSIGKKIVYYIIRCISHIFKPEYLIRKCEVEMTKYQECKTREITSMTGFYGYNKEKVDAELFKKYIELPFEETSFKAIKEYDRYLTQVYGNYMELPPVEKRRSHGLEYVDFGNY